MKTGDLMNRTSTRRSLVRGSSAAATGLLLGAGGVSSASAMRTALQPRMRVQDSQSLTFWVISPFTPDDQAPLFQAVQQYQEKTGVEVVVESFPPDSFRNRLITAVLGGEGADIVSIDSAWNAGLAAADIMTDITDRFAGIADQFFSGPVESGAYLENQYAVPWYTNNVGLYYNRGLFANAGVEAPPATWEEFVEIGTALTSDDTYGLMLGASGFGSFLFWPFAFQNGATLISQDGTQAEFGSDAGLEAWRYYSDFYLTHGIVPDDIRNATTSWDQLFAPFIQERTAMMMCGDWAIFAINDGNPDLDFGIAPLPQGEEAATVIGGYNLGIPASSEKVDDAWAFIEWMTAAEQMWILTDYNRIPARTDIVDTEFAQEDPFTQVFIEQADAGRARASVPEWDEIENTIVAEAWDSVILGQASPEDALATAVEEANALLSE
jgi:multiple sugar transport system substrate-binding protein